MGFAAIWKAMEGGDVWVTAMRHFAWQARYKRHPHQTRQEIGALIRWEGLRFGASDLQVASKWFCVAGAAPVNFLPPAQYFRQMGWKIARHWHEAVSSALNFSFLKEACRLVSFLTLSRARIGTPRKNFFVLECDRTFLEDVSPGSFHLWWKTRILASFRIDRWLAYLLPFG